MNRPRLRLASGALYLMLPLVALFLSGAPAQAADAASQDSSEVANDHGMFHLPPRLQFGELIYVPKIYYSSETSFGIGGQLIHPFRLPGTRLAIHGSDLRIKGRATFKGQGKAEGRTALRWHEGRHVLRLKLGYDSIPLRFYGVGQGSLQDNEEVYRPQRVFGYVEFLNKVFSKLRLGIRYEFERHSILESETGGAIADGFLKGSETSNAFGAGLLCDWDSRDSRYAPTTGFFWQGFGLFFDEELGSDHDFNNYSFDLRNYFSPAHHHVIATQLFVYAAKGAPPFWRYAALGGRVHSRGYRKNRFLDRMLLSFQAEYRSPLWRRCGYGVFAGIAQVAPALEHFEPGDFKPSIGGLIRYQPSRNSPLKIRLEVAFGNETPRIDLALDEAI